jgi:hypothetical protein
MSWLKKGSWRPRDRQGRRQLRASVLSRSAPGRGRGSRRGGGGGDACLGGAGVAERSGRVRLLGHLIYARVTSWAPWCLLGVSAGRGIFLPLCFLFKEPGFGSPFSLWGLPALYS